MRHKPAKSVNLTKSTAVDYTADSVNVPSYYNRVGPGRYESINFDKLANRISTQGFKMQPEPMRPYEVLVGVSSTNPLTEDNQISA